jgi:hypothetical protein
MKAQLNLRSTLGNTTSLQRGSAALAALALMALIGALSIYLSRPSAPAIPTAHLSVPAPSKLNVPISGTGSAYDGGHYGSAVPTGSATVSDWILALARSTTAGTTLGSYRHRARPPTCRSCDRVQSSVLNPQS